MSTYRYSNLTSAIDDKACPLRVYIDRRFPNAADLQLEYRESCGWLAVEGGQANPGTLGAAFDPMLRFALDPSYVPHLATRAFLGWTSPEVLRAIGEVAGPASSAASDEMDIEPLARSAWALALWTEIYRAGLLPGSPLVQLLALGQVTGEALLSLAPNDAVRQLRELYGLAEERLIPTVLPARRLYLGPTFDASTLCAADADVIHDGVLLEVKTRLGYVTNRRTGSRRDSLARKDLYQLICYLLFDHSDTYGIRSLALYSARYGHLDVWPLEGVLDVMAGMPVDLRAEREQVWQLLGGRG